MFPQIPWIERKFDFNLPVELFSVVLERFRGVTVRLEEMTGNLSEDILIFKPGGKWSVKEQAGHLLTLEALGEKRLDDFLNRKEILSPADMSNKNTREADFNKRNIRNILAEFREERQHLVSKLEKLTKEEASIISIHPRLNQKMRIIDWVYFMCEHDDHHLTSIRFIINSF